MKEIFDMGLNGGQWIILVLLIACMTALVGIAIYLIIRMCCEIKEAHDAELIHRGWLNHEEWTSEQIRRYRQETKDWNGVPMQMKKSERGEYLLTIPYVSNPDEEK